MYQLKYKHLNNNIIFLKSIGGLNRSNNHSIYQTSNLGPIELTFILCFIVCNPTCSGSLFSIIFPRFSLGKQIGLLII